MIPIPPHEMEELPSDCDVPPTVRVPTADGKPYTEMKNLDNPRSSYFNIHESLFSPRNVADSLTRPVMSKQCSNCCLDGKVETDFVNCTSCSSLVHIKCLLNETGGRLNEAGLLHATLCSRCRKGSTELGGSLFSIDMNQMGTPPSLAFVPSVFTPKPEPLQTRALGALGAPNLTFSPPADLMENCLLTPPISSASNLYGYKVKTEHRPSRKRKREQYTAYQPPLLETAQNQPKSYCKKCDKYFDDSRRLYLHKYTVHPDRIYQVPCGKKFKQKCHAKRHVGSSCKICQADKRNRPDDPQQ